MLNNVSSYFSPYLTFDRALWHQFRLDTPLTLNESDLFALQGQHESVSLTEIVEIYLPLSRLLNLYVAATQNLYRATTQFLYSNQSSTLHKPNISLPSDATSKMPYVIAIAGSVAVGKSTTSRILQALLSRWPDHPRVSLITTDGFLYSNAVLKSLNLMHKKGFPQSYDLRALITFLAELKSGKTPLQVPVYSHHVYDILPNDFVTITQSDIVIVEGLNVLQIPELKSIDKPQWFVSDFFDFSIYVHAETSTIRQWYVDRFMAFRAQAKTDPSAFFHQFSTLTEDEARSLAFKIWKDINEQNLIRNILPFKNRASLILEKDKHHAIQTVYLRKL